MPTFPPSSLGEKKICIKNRKYTGMKKMWKERIVPSRLLLKCTRVSNGRIRAEAELQNWQN